jgi:hypothetical protein
LIAGALDLAQDAALLLFFFKEAAKGHKERSQVLGVRCQENRKGSSSGLGVRSQETLVDFCFS